LKETEITILSLTVATKKKRSKKKGGAWTSFLHPIPAKRALQKKNPAFPHHFLSDKAREEGEKGKLGRGGKGVAGSQSMHQSG